MADPPLPNEAQLRNCTRTSSDRDGFYGCVVAKAMPREYRMTKRCLDDNPDDPGLALLCSTGRSDLEDAYGKFKEVEECTETAGSDRYAVAQCIGDTTLDENERYYLGCVTKNQGDLKTAAVCALAKDLNPEQQIALSCAIASAGEPTTFATCTGGQLLERGLDKCLDYGIATNRGCFGSNNEYRRFLSGVDDQMRRTFGTSSVAYQAYQAWQNDVLAPGPNHEVVKALNNGLNDIRNGPGPDNEIVKAGNAVGASSRASGARSASEGARGQPRTLQGHGQGAPARSVRTSQTRMPRPRGSAGASNTDCVIQVTAGAATAGGTAVGSSGIGSAGDRGSANPANFRSPC